MRDRQSVHEIHAHFPSHFAMRHTPDMDGKVRKGDMIEGNMNGIA